MIFTRRTIAVAVLLFTAVVWGYSQTVPPKELTGSISGKVTVQGNAVVGVVISLRSTEPKSYRQLMDQRGVTNANGEYRITDIPPGNYIVAPNAAAFIVAAGDSERRVIVNKGETVKDFDFSLMAGAVITGKVVDPDGKPVIEEEVHLFPESEQHPLSPFAAATTDDRGFYRVFGLKPGAYKVAAGRSSADSGGRRPSGVHMRAFYPGMSDFAQAAVIKVTEGTEASNIDITVSRLLTTHTANGRVVDGTGQPVKNVSIGYKRFGLDGETRKTGAVTNERGEFKLGNLVPGQYAVVAWAEPGSFFRVEELRFEIIDRDVTGLLVKTLEEASLSGVMVLDGTPDKEALEQLRKMRLVTFVETEESRKTGINGVTAEVEPNGNFRIGGLPAGNASFMVSGSGQPTFHVVRLERDGILQPRGIELKKAENVTGLRVVVAHANASLRGVIEVENGSLPPNARLFVRASRLHQDYASIDPTAQIDARGHFVFEAMVPGAHAISAGVFSPSSGFRVYKRQQVLVMAGSSNTITIKIDLNAPKPNQ